MAPELVAHRFVTAYQFRPTRAEPLVALARYHRGRNEFALAHLAASRAAEMTIPDDQLFVEHHAYQWRALDELAVSAYWVGEYGECAAACGLLLASEYLPDTERERILANLEHANREEARRESAGAGARGVPKPRTSARAQV